MVRVRVRIRVRDRVMDMHRVSIEIRRIK